MRRTRMNPMAALIAAALLIGAAGCRNNPVGTAETNGEGLTAGATTSAEHGQQHGDDEHHGGRGGDDEDDDGEPWEDEDDGRGTLDLELCAPGEHDFTVDIDNRYFPLPVGWQWYYEGDDDGTTVDLTVTVLDETEEIAGVTTRVVEEREREDGELVEVSHNFFAQTRRGTVCYFGEDVDLYEDGVVTSHAGSWRADEPGNAPGIFMPKNPKVGMRFPQESAPGVAQDQTEIVARGETVEVPYGTFKKTISVRDCNPLDGTCDEKVYARGVNLIVDEFLELNTLDR